MSFLDTILAGTPISEIATEAGPPVVLTGNTPNAGDTLVATSSTSAEWASTPGGGVIAGNGLLLTANTLSVKPAPGGGLTVGPAGVAVQALASDAQHGNLGGGALHALATDTAPGFMSPTEKLRLASAAVISEEAPLPNNGAASAGVSDLASAADHTHPNDWKGACRAVWAEETLTPDAAPLYADGAGPLAAGDRVLWPAFGVYEVVTPGTGTNGAWVFVPSEITTRSLVWIAQGDTYGGSVWRGASNVPGDESMVPCGPFVTYRPPCWFISYEQEDLTGVPLGETTITAGMRILLTGQDDGAENGPWIIQTGAWTRPPDFARSVDIGAGIQYLIEYGQMSDSSSYVQNALWIMDDPGEPFVLGVTGSYWTQANGTAGIELGYGLKRTGSRSQGLDVQVDTVEGSIVVNNPNGLRVGVLSFDGQHGNRGGGALHADATTTVSGFFSGAEKVKLAGVATGAAALTATAPAAVDSNSAVVGVATTAARADHKHVVNVAVPVSLTVGGSNSGGSNAALCRSDHTHGLPAYGSTSGTFAQGNDTRFLKASTLSGATDVSISGTPAPVQGQALRATAAATAAWSFSNACGAVNQLRLTLNASNAIPVADIPAATSIWLLPYTGTLIALYSSTVGQVVPIATNGATLALSGLTTDLVYDVFGYLTNQANPLAGNVGLELLAWTSSSVRATSVIRSTVSGFLIKSGDETRRYLGTIRARAANGSLTWRMNGNDTNTPRVDLWNNDNQVPIMPSFLFANATYAVTVASAWQVQGNAKLEFVQGQWAPFMFATGAMSTGHASAGNEGNAAFVQDAALTTVLGLRGKFKTGAASEVGMISPSLVWQPAIGSHTLSLALLSNVTTQVFYGTDGGGVQSGFTATLMC